MSRLLVSTGSPFEAQAGYSRAVAVGPWCFVSGTTGYDYASMQMPDDVADQAKNALATIQSALGQAGFSLADVVRVVVYLAKPEDFEAVWPVMGAAFGAIRPANTTVAATLVKPEMKVEIEVTAFKGP
jgi:enamine deaminase RidA (YjgF/YER057c/UK114 family)